MTEFNLGIIFNTIIAAIGIALIMAVVGMGVWYIKVKPDIDGIKKDLAEKAAAAEVTRLHTAVEQKRVDTERLQHSLDDKQNIAECNLQRKACQPLLLEQLKSLSSKIDDLRESDKSQAGKLDRLMLKNGIGGTA
jgi:ActR/RegA family two-component response regulator